MRKLHSYFITSKRSQVFITILLFIGVVLYGCFKLKSLDHPTSAETYSHFDVKFVCEPDVGIKTEGKGYFGVLLPNGWRPAEYTDYTVLFPEGSSNIYGRFCYDRDYTNSLTKNFEAPKGYFWWGARSIDDIELINSAQVKCDNFSFTFRIHTDHKTGNFNLRYLIGTNGNGENPIVPNGGLYVDEKRTITITENPNPVIEDIKISQPGSAQTYSFSDVDISYTSNMLDEKEHAYFGALLPKGWRVADYTDCKVTKDGTETASGRFSYDQYYSDLLNVNYTTPEGYYWWGGRTIDNLPLNSTSDLSFKFRIYNDHQTGDFNLRYIISAGPDRAIRDYLVKDVYYPVSVTEGNKFPVKKELNWDLLSNKGWDEKVDFYWDRDYDGLFTRWYGWNGGDIGISTPLGDGRSIWVWGDSHTGQVNSKRARLTDQAQFERNFIIVQDGEDFSAFKLANEGSPSLVPDGLIVESVIPTDDDGNNLGKHSEWYWPNASTVFYRNGIPELHMVLSRMEDTGEGTMWAMRGIGTDVAVFSLPDLKFQKIEKYQHKTVEVERIEQNWLTGEDELKKYSLGYAGQVFTDDDGTVYVYSSAGRPGICATISIVARVKNGDLTADWEFYNAESGEWSTDTSWQQWPEGASATETLDRWIAAGLKKVEKNEEGQSEIKEMDKLMFVFKDGGRYYAFGMNTCFGRDLYIYDAETPYGPFSNERIVGRLPDEISDGYVPSLPDLHQQYSKNGELLFSISKNYDNDAREKEGYERLEWYNVPGCADEYRPHFFRSKNWRDKLNIIDMDVTDNKGILTAQYDDNINYLTDNTEETVYSASGNSAWIQYESPSVVNLKRYTITSTKNDSAKDPLHWKLLASTDGKKWTTIDERYYAEFEERLQTVSYVVPINGFFTHFRLDILATKGGQGLEIAEWQMFGQFEYIPGELAELEQVTINGNSVPIADVMNVDIMPSTGAEIKIDLEAKDYGLISGVDKSFIATMDKAGIVKYSIKVTSEDGKLEKDYELVLNRWFAFDEVIKVKWNNTLMLYLNRLEEYNISAYQWYQNDKVINGATGKTYSAGSKKADVLDQNSTYYIRMKTLEGDLRSEAKQIPLISMDVKVYPNPVKSNGTITVEADIEDEILTGATIELYNSLGNKISTHNVQGRSTSINVPSAIGTYMIKFRSNNSFEKTSKIIVK